jgi:hypothetical protein
MRRLLIALIAALSLTACGDLFDKCPGETECGGGCMPNGSSCCPNGSGYCDGGYYCGSDNMCHGSGGGGGGSYYVNGSGCTVGYSSVTYSGSSSSTCQAYYQAAVAARCTKILWKCN